MLNRQEYKRILTGKYSVYESLLWLLCTTLFFVGFSTGSIWVDMVLPAAMGFLFAIVVSASLARETWRYEWVDKSGVSISSHPSLVNRCLVLTYRASVLFIPVAFFGYGADIKFLWIIKILYVVVASLWLVAILTYGSKILWKIELRKATLNTFIALLAMLLPIGYLCTKQYWTKKMINYLDIVGLQRVEVVFGYVFLIIGFIALSYILMKIFDFILKGGGIRETSTL